MKVSVIIPVYNIAPYIRQCLQSVMAQTMTEGLECILVDDCGSDNSMTIVQQMVDDYVGDIHFVIAHHERNRGLAAARNTGIHLAQGEYIGFIDSDDWVEPTMFEDLYRLMEANPQCIFAGSSIIGEFSGKQEPYYGRTDKYIGAQPFTPLQFMKELITERTNPVNWNKLYRRTFIVHDLVEGRNSEDYLFHYFNCKPLIANGVDCQILFSDKLHYHYRALRPNSIMRQPLKTPNPWYLDYILNIRDLLNDAKGWNQELYDLQMEKYRKLLVNKFMPIITNPRVTSERKVFMHFYLKELRMIDLAQLPRTLSLKISLFSHIPCLIPIYQKSLEIKNVRDRYRFRLKRWLQMRKMGVKGYFEEVQRLETQRLLSSFYKDKPIGNVSQDVIFQSNGFRSGGGLADRLKGMITLYDWCKRNNRTFRINCTEPFRLQSFLVPNQVDWIPEVISYCSTEAIPKMFFMSPYPCSKESFKRHQDEWTEEWMNQQLSETSKQLHVYINSLVSTLDFATLFNELFVPSPQLQKEIDHYSHQIGKDYISVSFRFAKLLGDLEDTYGTTLSPKKQEQLIAKSIKALEQIISSHPDIPRVLVTADSNKFLSAITSLPKVYVIPGKAGHLDYARDEEVHLKTFLDFFLISHAQTVYLACGPGMYQGEFAYVASLVNNRPYRVFSFG